MKLCKRHDKTKPNIKILDLLMKNWKLRVWCPLFHFLLCDFLDFISYYVNRKELGPDCFSELTLPPLRLIFNPECGKKCDFWTTYPPLLVQVVIKRPPADSTCKALTFKTGIDVGPGHSSLPDKFCNLEVLKSPGYTSKLLESIWFFTTSQVQLSGLTYLITMVWHIEKKLKSFPMQNLSCVKNRMIQY